MWFRIVPGAIKSRLKEYALLYIVACVS